MPPCTAPSAPVVTASWWRAKTRRPRPVRSKRSQPDPRRRAGGEALAPADHDERTSPARRPGLPVPAGGGSRPRSACRRLLSLVGEETALPAGDASPRDSAGVATAYGEVERGGAALFAAAADA